MALLKIITLRRTLFAIGIFFQLLVLIYIFDYSPQEASLLRQSSKALYRYLLEKYTAEELEELSLNEKCKAFFERLYVQDNYTSLDSFEGNKYSTLSKQQIKTSVGYLRAYGRCFVDNYFPNIGMCNDVEYKLFPFFSQELPVYKRWDGIVRQIPIMNNNEDNLLQENSISTCFWNQFIHQANGKGIVISVGEGQVEDVVRLIKVLRYLKNLLPIEIVHKGDLSQGSQDWIIRTSRTRITISEDFLIDDSLQDIWFVDASKAIHPLYIEVFKRFSNKWIASLFNSFDEMVLMDSDTVPFVPPEHFLNMESRKLKGALFFKDRAIGETISSSDVSFYKELLPSVAEWKLFNLSMATEITMDNAFFKHKQKHVMESGVVVLQRSTHLLGLLISTVLQLKKATSSPIYGDKELFWLGQSIAGNEDYTFNSNSAGAVGVVKDDIYEDFYSICSTQVAHFDSHKTLLWLNGGLKVCKKPSWQRDYAKQKHLRKTFKSVEELKENYQSSIQINGAIIPNNVEYKFLKKPSRGFKKNPSLGCSGYFWCAFTHVDDYEDYVIRYTQEEIRHFDIIIKIWSS